MEKFSEKPGGDKRIMYKSGEKAKGLKDANKGKRKDIVPNAKLFVFTLLYTHTSI